MSKFEKQILFNTYIASPLTNLFYKGLNLISIYHDGRLRKTIEESITAIKDNGENIVIFPEDSGEGYSDELKGFYAGFVLLQYVIYCNLALGVI